MHVRHATCPVQVGLLDAGNMEQRVLQACVLARIETVPELHFENAAGCLCRVLVLSHGGTSTGVGLTLQG
ncbi:hypothetical protein GCM10010840_36610 [Deinococcus aerolatus]|uniref:Uncharacterized protein n=1 Tax=Deinococcus aerolatus TaxID=522487 RepID=A0ABQ2GHR5_9DEIO|nr:hypothetical protein GCM10010840_36610 [Deinococcus aerolatus]